MANSEEASSQEDESLTEKSMEPVVMFHSTGTKMHNNCCKSLYQRRKLKNKGAIVVIIWNYLVTSLVNYLVNYASDYKPCACAKFNSLNCLCPHNLLINLLIVAQD